MALFVLPPLYFAKKNGIYEMSDLPGSYTVLGIFKESSYAVMVDNRDVCLVNDIGGGTGSFVKMNGVYAGTLIAGLETHTRVCDYQPCNTPEEVAGVRKVCCW